MSPLPLVFWLLSCKVFPVGQQLQPRQPALKAGYNYGTTPVLASHGIIMRNLLDSSSSAQASIEKKRYFSIKGLAAIYFQAKELYTQLSEFTQTISVVLVRARTHTLT